MFNYLDAGTGSMIVTALAGGIAGIGVAIKMGMSRFKAKFSSKSNSDPASEDAADGDSSSSTN
ncbi:MAG: hypothetical protein EXQ63_01230 [Ilumatobacteraceae bacterium]|nr:hypothetical protein [Ilumatobacteraceae bacterium]